MTFSKIPSSSEFDYKKFIWLLNSKFSAYFKSSSNDQYDPINPFIYHWNVPWYQWIKMVLVTVTILPFRAIGFLIAFGIAYLLAFIALVGKPEVDVEEPMCGWRKNIVLPIFLIFARLCYFFSSVHWVKVKGKRCSVNEAPILVLAPHSAFMDSLFVVFLGMNSVIGKTETAKSSVGYLLRMTQPILVTREDPNSRQNTIGIIKKRCYSKANWPQMLIFPEGTCTNRSCLINFKTGAFIPGRPIQPVILRWPNRIDCITWTWNGPGVWSLLWMLFSQLHTFVEIEFLPVYRPNDNEKMNSKLFADNVRAVMAKALNVPITNYSYEDCRHMTLAKMCSIPFTEIIVEFSRLHKRLLCLRHDTIAMLNWLLGTLYRCGDGLVSLHELCQLVSMTNNEALMERIFKFYDKTNSGSMDMRDLFGHLALYSLPFDRRLAIDYVIKGYRLTDRIDIVDATASVLQKMFGLPCGASVEILSFVKLLHCPDQSFSSTLDSIMRELGGPFNMYVEYHNEYNRSTSGAVTSNHQSSLTCPSQNVPMDNTRSFSGLSRKPDCRWKTE